jgi:hypothetical protein
VFKIAFASHLHRIYVAFAFPSHLQALVREPDSAMVDADDGVNEYTYVNLNPKADVNPKGTTVRPTGILGTGFGRSGFYQRRWVQSLRNKKGSQKGKLARS